MSTVVLADVCEVVMGQAPPGDSYNTSGIGVPLLAGAGDFGLLHPRPHRFTTQPTRLSEVGDILLCVRATIGERNWSDRQYSLGRGAAAIRSRSPNSDLRYIWHWLARVRPVLEGRARGSTFKQVTREAIESLPLLLPPLVEQRRTAEILDKADSIRRKRRESMQLLNLFVRSAYLEMFGDPVGNEKGWDVVRMNDVVAETQYGTSAPANSQKDGLPVLRMNNITSRGAIDVTSLKWCAIQERHLANYTVRRGDLLFNRTNSPELVGKTAVWDRDDVYAFAGYLVRVRFDLSRVLPEYVSGYLNSDYGKRLLLSKAKPSINMSNISASEFRRLPIPIPTMAAQTHYVEVQHKARAALERIEQAAVLADSLFASLADGVFNAP